MGKVVAASLRFNVLGELACERHQRVAGNVAAFGLTEIAILDGLEHLGLCSEDDVFRFRDVAIDHGCESRIFFLFERARTLELGFAFNDPDVGGRPAVESLGFAMNDRAAFLDEDLGSEGFGAVFASPSNYRTHRLPYLCQSAPPVRPITGNGTTRTLEVRRGRTTEAKMGKNGPKMVRHEPKRKWIKSLKKRK